MNDKINKFLVELKILDDFEVKTLSTKADLSYSVKDNIKKTIIIDIAINECLPLDIYEKIQNAKSKYDQEDFLSINIKANHDSLNYDGKLLTKYLYYFLKYKINPNAILKSLIDHQAFIQDENNNIVCYYLFDSEKNEIKKHEVLLRNFFNEIFINVKDFIYQIDIKRQNEQIELIKKKEQDRLNEIEKAKNKPIEDLKNKNVVKLNKISLDQITLEDKRVGIEGQVFKIEVITTRNNDRIYNFFIYDYKEGLKISCFSSKEARNWGSMTSLPFSYLDSIKENDWIEAEIMVEQGYGLNAGLVGKILKIRSIPLPKFLIKQDDYPLKRIELLSRTKMSSFDGLIDTNHLIERSIKYHWPAIASIDRYNVQAYADIMRAAKKHKQKVLYGVDFDVLSKTTKIVNQSIDQELENGTYVIFDLETTGLYPQCDDIIEFGAIKIVNGIRKESINFFIKPKKKLSDFIIQKTHITNEMLENGIDIQTALKRIVDFFGDAILIAHNGLNFDYRFINVHLEKNNLPLLKNVLIDTLQISRLVNDIRGHSLGNNCKLFNIRYNANEAHRADFDCEVLYLVWNNLIQKLKARKIVNINQLNNQENSLSLYSKQFSSFFHVYIKNQEGVADLYRIISLSHTTDFHNKPRVFYEDINQKRKNFIIANSPNEGDVWDAALSDIDENLIKVMSFYDYIFIAPVNNMLHEIKQKKISSEDVKKTLLRIIHFAKKLNKKVCAVSDAYYLDIEEQIAHLVYINTKGLNGVSHRLFNRETAQKDYAPDLHLRTTREMIEEWSFLNDQELINEIVIHNTHDFSAQIANDIKPLKSDLYAPKIDGVNDKLKQLVYQTLEQKYGKQVHSSILERVDRELKLIIEKNYGVIYWISHLLVKKSLDDGYLVGSRGSVGSSIIAYLSGISEVNPLPAHYICDHCHHHFFDDSHQDGFDLPTKLCPKCQKPMRGDGHQIPFETFLGFHGEKIPDIDLNFSGVYQGKAHDFIKEMFGEAHAFRAGTIGTVANKTAYGFAIKYFEATKQEAVPNSVRVDWVTRKLVDVKRTTGQHPGGIIVVPKEMNINEFSPYNYPADDTSSSWKTTHFAFENLHDNLLKFDILGHDDPTTLKILEELTGVKATDVPFRDHEVMKLFSSIESLKLKNYTLLDEKVGSFAIPEFGTEFVRKMLTQTNPQSFADLIRISGLSHGTDVWLNNAQNLINESNLKLSQVIACRDDIMVYLIKQKVEPQIAFQIMESVRKGKGVPQAYIESIKDKVPIWYLDSCNKIKYLFPKAHAAAYVMMAWRIAWFKIHYPLAFYAAIFSIRPDEFDVELAASGLEKIKEKLLKYKSIINLMKRKDYVGERLKQVEIDLIPVYEIYVELYERGYKIGMIDLYKSQSSRFIIENDTIIPPFCALNGLGLVAAESIVKAREQMPFKSKEDLLNRTKINKTTLEKFNDLKVLGDLSEDDQLTLDEWFQ